MKASYLPLGGSNHQKCQTVMQKHTQAGNVTVQGNK